MTSEARNRLSAIAAVCEGNESGLSSDKPSPVIEKVKVFKEPRVKVGNPPISESYKKENRKTVEFSNEGLSRGEKVVLKVTARNGGNVPNLGPKGQGQIHEIKRLSFTTLEENNKNNNHGMNNTEVIPTTTANQITKCEARRRALRKMNGIYGKERKMLPKIPTKNVETESQNFQNNNNGSKTNVNHSPSKTIVVHSRENSSSTAVPSSANSTLSDGSLTSAKDESSVENSPVRQGVHKHRPSSHRKAKTIGYRKGKDALLRERLKKASTDPMRVSPSELNEIQNYWKRMSLCLDEINIDEELA